MARITTKELVKECAAASKASAGKQSNAGLIWLRGRPTPAPNGGVGLKLDDGSTAVVLEKDVVEAERGDEGDYGVGLSMDTDILIVRAVVRRAFEVSTDKGGGCGCSGTTAMARPFGWGGLGGCIAHCNALEGFCMGSGGGISFFTVSTTVEDLQDALLHGARCRDIWYGCISNCFDATFSHSVA